jgi:pimeloyl-ACP methyl ester carboxylesterase
VTPRRRCGDAAILSLLLVLGCARSQARPPDPSVVSLPAVTRGSGPDVVLVHGAVGDYRIWEGVVAELSGEYRLVAISRRFHWPALAAPASGEYTYEHQADDLARFLQMRGGRAHVVAHSYGAGVALLVALRHPQLIRTLVLIEPPFSSVVPGTADGFIGEIASRDSLVATVRSAVAAGMHERAAEALIDWVQAGVGRFSDLPAKVQQHVHTNARTVGPSYSSSAPRITCEDLRALDVPVLVVTGRETRLWYQLIARHTRECILRAEASTIPNAGHMVIAEQPSATAAVLARFLERARNATPR